MKTNSFWGCLTDISAENEALSTVHCAIMQLANHTELGLGHMMIVVLLFSKFN